MKVKRLLFIYAGLLILSVFLLVWLISLPKAIPTVVVLRDYNAIIADRQINIVTDYNAVGYYVSGDSTVGVQYDLIKKLERDWDVNATIFLENSLHP